MLSFVLDQVADLEAALTELYRVLRPGGRWCASVWAFDKLRPLDQSLYGALIAVVARHAPGALAGAASRASVPHEREHMAAFAASELLRPEERDGQLALVMEDVDTAMAFFSRRHGDDAQRRGPRGLQPDPRPPPAAHALSPGAAATLTASRLTSHRWFPAG